MKNVWLVISGIILFFTAMVIITLTVPEVKAFASGIAQNKHLPLWLVGFLAPVIYIFQKIADGIKTFSGLKSGVITENKRIVDEQERIRRELDSLLDWRSRTLQQEYENVKRVKNDIVRMETQLNHLSSQIQKVQNTSVHEISASMSEQESNDVFDEYYKNLGATIYKSPTGEP